MNGCTVSIAFPDPGIGARLFPAELSKYVNDYYRSKGVEVLDGEMVAKVARDGDGYRVETESGKTIDAEEVVAGLGIVPNTELAESLGPRDRRRDHRRRPRPCRWP